MQSREAIVIGTIADTWYEESINELGEKVFRIMVGTINDTTYINDEYTFSIAQKSATNSITEDIKLRINR